MQGQKLPQKKNKKNKKKKRKAKKMSEITSEEYVPSIKTSFTLGQWPPDDDLTEGEVAQCYMVSWADECEEVKVKPLNTTQQVGQVTLWSGHQLQPPALVGKEKKKETTPNISPILASFKEKGEEEVIPSTLNSKGTAENKQSTKESNKDLPIPIPFQVRQESHKEKVCYDVISLLKRIPVRLSVCSALQMSKELRRHLFKN